MNDFKQQKNDTETVQVTKTYLPNIDKYKKYVDMIYESGKVTNDGPLVKLLEEKLATYLGVKNIVLVANGTVALEIAYRTLGLKGLAVTTPFSFVATTSSLVTNGLQPIFADIDHLSYNINPDEIRRVITKNTSVIVPTHVFGNVCEVDDIDSIAKDHGVKVVYDAAHAFGVKYKGENILRYGDISTLSFHATKLFHTIEGGALIINDDTLVEKAKYLINFGIQDEESIPELGTNAKMNEFEAAMGLCVLDDMDTIIGNRKKVYSLYQSELAGLLQTQKIDDDVSYNYAYFPVLFQSEEQLKKTQQALVEMSCFPRRYFYPSLDSLSYIEPKQFCPVSRDISSRSLSLPISDSLDEGTQRSIIQTVKSSLI